ncbi:hypothetical protein HJP15_09980 [Pseudoalteromonas sp. NEC-BIFX-2020_002]|uniref:hypothetical protein n=1 Tax=Pseudoalteromonas sp. NEC-BIFX-2020_002 TaxID=2732353 RepID=UPI0014776C98|nr:hypothetical protein [Pseudoalteromonas sp. NEC-BIFX-2020_002]
MKKITLAISILALVVFYFIPKEHSEIEKFSDKSDSEKVVSKGLKPKEKSTIETDIEVSALVSAEEYLFEAKEIRRCSAIPKTQDELDNWLGNANEVGEPYEYIEDVLSLFERCSQISFISDDFIELLVKAIKLGSDDAMTELWAISDKEYFQSKGLLELNREKTIEQRIKFDSLKFQLSESVALTGGEQSILRLVKEYQNYDPDTGNPNYLKAIAYADFGLKIVEDNDIHLKLDFIKLRITQNMEFQDIEQAQVLTEKLLNKFGENRN